MDCGVSPAIGPQNPIGRANVTVISAVVLPAKIHVQGSRPTWQTDKCLAICNFSWNADKVSMAGSAF